MYITCKHQMRLDFFSQKVQINPIQTSLKKRTEFYFSPFLQ